MTPKISIPSQWWPPGGSPSQPIGSCSLPFSSLSVAAWVRSAFNSSECVSSIISNIISEESFGAIFTVTGPSLLVCIANEEIGAVKDCGACAGFSLNCFSSRVKTKNAMPARKIIIAMGYTFFMIGEMQLFFWLYKQCLLN